MEPDCVSVAIVRPVQRVLVGGISGAGKSTLARVLARRLGVSYVELDALHHGPGWVKRPSFEADVAALAASNSWVIDSLGYPSVRDLLWERADTLVWLDLERPVVMRRVLWRSFVRATYDRQLWNGNTESFRDWPDPEHPIRWAWSQHGPRRKLVAERLANPRWAHLDVVHLRTPKQAARWVAGIQSARQGEHSSGQAG